MFESFVCVSRTQAVNGALEHVTDACGGGRLNERVRMADATGMLAENVAVSGGGGGGGGGGVE